LGPDEIMFVLTGTEACTGEADSDTAPSAKSVGQADVVPPSLVVVNVSPIERCHFLLVPAVTSGLPQRLTRSSLQVLLPTLWWW
jgi:hypothetical protein